MNALVSIETLTPAVVFAPGGVEGLISKVEDEVRATPRDITTPAGREAIKSLAYKVARSKTALDEMGKELVAGIKAQAATIDADRRTIRDRLDRLKEEVRGPVDAWEAAEAKRISGHEAILSDILTSTNLVHGATSESIRMMIECVSTAKARIWEEFQERAVVAIADTLAKLEPMLATAEKAEAEAAELADLRRQKAEREEADRAAAEAKARAEAERLTAEHSAEAARIRAEQVEQDKAAAAARAVEQERQRVAAENARQAAAERKREANAKHRAKVHREIVAALGSIEPGPAALVEAIASGRIAHVSITY